MVRLSGWSAGGAPCHRRARPALSLVAGSWVPVRGNPTPRSRPAPRARERRWRELPHEKLLRLQYLRQAWCCRCTGLRRKHHRQRHPRRWRELLLSVVRGGPQLRGSMVAAGVLSPRLWRQLQRRFLGGPNLSTDAVEPELSRSPPVPTRRDVAGDGTHHVRSRRCQPSLHGSSLRHGGFAAGFVAGTVRGHVV